MLRKVYVYVCRTIEDRPHLLVFESHDEPGETLEQAVHRELLEETGLTAVRLVSPLGVARWHNEEQHAFRVEASLALPESFEQPVTGHGIDGGLRYRYRWLPIGPALQSQLVQGGDRFVDALLAGRR